MVPYSEHFECLAANSFARFAKFTKKGAAVKLNNAPRRIVLRGGDRLTTATLSDPKECTIWK